MQLCCSLSNKDMAVYKCDTIPTNPTIADNIYNSRSPTTEYSLPFWGQWEWILRILKTEGKKINIYNKIITYMELPSPIPFSGLLVRF